MSGKSCTSGSMRSCGSVRLGASSTHEVVLDALYERKRDKKTVRVLTVIVYVFCVSLAAIMLSLYYVFFWEPKDAHYAQRKVAHNVERQTTTTPMPTCFMPHTERGNTTVSEVSSTQAPLANVTSPPDLSTIVQDVNNMTAFNPTRDFFNVTSDGIGLLYNETNIT